VSFNGQSLLSANLQLTLTGPTPWHLFGHARFELLGFKVEAPVELKFGDERPAPLPPPVVVFDLVRAALADTRNWSAVLPDGTVPVATLRPREDGAAGVVVHPLATVSVRQRVAPL